MNHHLKSRLYYLLKPLLPRSVQIALRRRLVLHTMRKVAQVWPIDPASGRKPVRCPGWPSGRRFAFVITHDVEGVRGVSRCLRLSEMEKGLGLKSSFNFVPEGYALPAEIRQELARNGFEVGVHDLRHDGTLFKSERDFRRQAAIINSYLELWKAVGFRSGAMFHNLDWMHAIQLEYDSSTFDTDPFEPQPDGIGTVFPMWVPNPAGNGGYVEMPYTLPQDFTEFILLRRQDAGGWMNKVDWIAEQGGMVLLNTHPDYMYWGNCTRRVDEYNFEIYAGFLRQVKERYQGQYWNAVPRDVARYWKACVNTPGAGNV